MSVMPPGSPIFLIRPLQLFKWTSGICVALLLINLGAIYLKKVLLLDAFWVNLLYYFFDASSEANVPTLYSTLLLFTATLSLFAIYSTVAKLTRTRVFWLVLTCIFLFLTVDEAATVHEQFNKYNGDLKEKSPYLHYTWVIPYSIFAVGVGIFFLRFLFRLPYRTRLMFIVAGGMYVGAAIGFELMEGRVVSEYGAGTVQDKLFCAVEEFLEMASISIFIYALLNYMEPFKVTSKIEKG